MNCNDCYCHCESDTPNGSYSYAQYGVQSNPPSNTDIPMTVLFQEGKQITLKTTEILLEAGYLYLINFIFLATPEADSFIQITPKIDGSLRLLYSVFASTGSASRNTSATGGITIPVYENTSIVSFSLTYPDTAKNIDITGAISVTALHKLSVDTCW